MIKNRILILNLFSFFILWRKKIIIDGSFGKLISCSFSFFFSADFSNHTYLQKSWESNTVDYCLIGTWFNSILDLAARIPWSQIFIGFYNLVFSWFNNTWFNSQIWFTGTIFLSQFFFPIFWSHGKTIPYLNTIVRKKLCMNFVTIQIFLW